MGRRKQAACGVARSLSGRRAPGQSWEPRPGRERSLTSQGTGMVASACPGPLCFYDKVPWGPRCSVFSGPECWHPQKPVRNADSQTLPEPPELERAFEKIVGASWAQAFGEALLLGAREQR